MWEKSGCEKSVLSGENLKKWREKIVWESVVWEKSVWEKSGVGKVECGKSPVRKKCVEKVWGGKMPHNGKIDLTKNARNG